MQSVLHPRQRPPNDDLVRDELDRGKGGVPSRLKGGGGVQGGPTGVMQIAPPFKGPQNTFKPVIRTTEGRIVLEQQRLSPVRASAPDDESG